MMGEKVEIDELPFDHIALTVVPCDECEKLVRPYEAELGVSKEEVIGISSIDSFILGCGHEVSTDHLRENYAN